jgi:AcrR family transcriptional regulator
MKKGEATRQRIIERSAPLFNRRGFDGCSMQDLMEATGLEKGGLYRHFANKEELAAASFRHALAQNVKLRTEHLDGIPNAVEKLRTAIAHFVQTPSTVDGGCPLLNTAVDADDGNPVLRELVLKGVTAWKARLGRIVTQGQRHGEISPGVSPRAIANTIVATLEGAVMISRLERSRQALHDAQSSLELMLASIAAPKPVRKMQRRAAPRHPARSA